MTLFQPTTAGASGALPPEAVMGPPEELIAHEFYVIGQERGWQWGKSRLQEEKPVLIMPGHVVRRMTYHSRAEIWGDFR